MRNGKTITLILSLNSLSEIAHHTKEMFTFKSDSHPELEASVCCERKADGMWRITFDNIPELPDLADGGGSRTVFLWGMGELSGLTATAELTVTNPPSSAA